MHQKQKSYYLGILSEWLVILMLFLTGHRILKSRFKCRYGEIDIISNKADKIYFIEVKYRHKNTSEVLTTNQILRIKRSGEFFIAQNSKYQKSTMIFQLFKVNKFFLISRFNIL